MRKADGTLTPAEEFTVKATWDDFRKSTVSVETPRYQVEELQRAYMAGFACAFHVFSEYTEVLTEDEGSKLLNKIVREIDKYIAEVLEENNKLRGALKKS